MISKMMSAVSCGLERKGLWLVLISFENVFHSTEFHHTFLNNREHSVVIESTDVSTAAVEVGIAPCTGRKRGGEHSPRLETKLFNSGKYGPGTNTIWGLTCDMTSVRE